tara:strand:+ start:362 stop:844 length:483 start_codon:yes stop_codon:yes gene_type:complete
MKLKEKISLVLFSDIEEKFLELILEGNIDDTLSLIEQVISPSEFKVFQQKTQMPFPTFLEKLHTLYNTNSDFVADYDKNTSRWNRTFSNKNKVCVFPGCESQNTQKDHIIPLKLNKTNLFKFIPEPSFNSMPLCNFHNRVKTDSILIGISFLLHLRNDLV